MLTIDDREAAGTTIIHPVGRIDTSTARAFETHIGHHIENSEGPLLVDLADVDYVSSFGLRSILIAVKKLAPFGRKLVLFAPNPSVLEVLRVSGFLKIVDMVDDEPAALARASGAPGAGG